MAQWFNGAPPKDMGEQDIVWIVSEVESRFRRGIGIYSYKLFVWHKGGGWSDREVLRTRRWMYLPIPEKDDAICPHGYEDWDYCPDCCH